MSAYWRERLCGVVLSCFCLVATLLACVSPLIFPFRFISHLGHTAHSASKSYLTLSLLDLPVSLLESNP